MLNIPKYSLTPDNVRRINRSLYPHSQRYQHLYEHDSVVGLRSVTQENCEKEEVKEPKSSRKFQLKPLISEIKSFNLSDLETLHKVHPDKGGMEKMSRPPSELEKMLKNGKDTSKINSERSAIKTPGMAPSHKKEKKLKAVSLNFPESKNKPNEQIFNKYTKEFNFIE